MPQLRVEYAKSGRAKCSLTSCKKPIAKHEVRIGTVMTLPFGEEGVESVAYRHVCCFTARQLSNAKATLDDIEGYNDLAPADKALIDQMKKGELVGKTQLIGRVGDVANSPLAAELGATEKTAAAGKAPRAKREKKAPAKPPQEEDAEAVDSDATEEFEVDVRAVSARPVCPYGANCFRTAPDHFEQFSHDDGDTAAPPSGADTAVRPVIVGKKRARQ